MSFLSKIVEKKAVTLAIIGGALALGFALLYKGYKDQDKQESIEQKDGFDLNKEIQALKSQINTSNPSLDDIKQVLTFSMNVAKRKIITYSKQFKRKRQQFKGDGRKNNTKEYMNIIVNGMDQVRNLAVVTQSEIMKQLGLSQAVFLKYQSQLGMFMQELMMRQAKDQGSHKKVTLEQVKYALRLQIEYLRNHGQQIIGRVLEATKSWPPAKKRQLPLLFSVVIADGAFEDHPEIDEQAIQAAQVEMQNHLLTQMQELHQVMSPLMAKITKQVGGGMGMGMGGMGMGMGMEGGMGEDMFNGGFTEQQMLQMQQLQQLRISDPIAFEQLMRSFHG